MKSSLLSFDSFERNDGSIRDMYYHVNEKTGQKAPLIADDVYEIVMKVHMKSTALLIFLTV